MENERKKRKKCAHFFAGSLWRRLGGRFGAERLVGGRLGAARIALHILLGALEVHFKRLEKLCKNVFERKRHGSARFAAVAERAANVGPLLGVGHDLKAAALGELGAQGVQINGAAVEHRRLDGLAEVVPVRREGLYVVGARAHLALEDIHALLACLEPKVLREIMGKIQEKRAKQR